MIDPAGRQHNLSAMEGLVSKASKNQAPKSQSFARAFSDEVARRTTTASNTEGVTASTLVRQESAARRDPSGPVAPTSRPTTPLPGLSGLVITYPPTSSTSGGPSSTTSVAVDAAATSASFDDKYWASQPAAVQQLRNIQDPTQRAETATQLADEGYKIDVPIMVWGWDPQITTTARESMGYTWVPSALQQPVEVAPGMTFGGTAYNPAQPPTGSITV